MDLWKFNKIMEVDNSDGLGDRVYSIFNTEVKVRAIF